MSEQLTLRVSGAVYQKSKKLDALINKTNKENPRAEDLAALRKMLDECPDLWRGVGNMARRALENIARCYYEKSAYAQEIAFRRSNELREQLGYKDAPPLERILIEQIPVCHLNLYVLEMRTAWKLAESHTTEMGLYWDRRLSGAQRRFTRACETLTKVRRLSRPNVQINVAAQGGQQLNVA